MESRRSTTPSEAPRLECPLCGNDKVRTIMHPHAYSYGTGEAAVELPVTLPVRRCDACDFEYLDEVSEDLKQEALCKHFGVLPPGEIRGIREHHGMTRARFAEVTGIGEASLNRWENALNIQTHAYDRYLRLLALPGIMQHLKEIVERRPSPRAGSGAGENQFRTLEVSDEIRRDQDRFRLRPAA